MYLSIKSTHWSLPYTTTTLNNKILYNFFENIHYCAWPRLHAYPPHFACALPSSCSWKLRYIVLEIKYQFCCNVKLAVALAYKDYLILLWFPGKVYLERHSYTIYAWLIPLFVGFPVIFEINNYTLSEFHCINLFTSSLSGAFSWAVIVCTVWQIQITPGHDFPANLSKEDIIYGCLAILRYICI